MGKGIDSDHRTLSGSLAAEERRETVAGGVCQDQGRGVVTAVVARTGNV